VPAQRGLSLPCPRDGAEGVQKMSLLFTVCTIEGGPASWLKERVVCLDHRGAGLRSRFLLSALACARSNGSARITLLTDRLKEGTSRFDGRPEFRLSELTVLGWRP
jgi:hypothetical protein